MAVEVAVGVGAAGEAADALDVLSIKRYAVFCP